MRRRYALSTIALCLLYGALIGGWLRFARGLASSILDDSRQGGSSSLLNRLVQVWRSSLPGTSAHQRWLVFSSAVAIGGLIHLVIVLFIRALERRRRELPELGGVGDRWSSLAVSFLALAFLSLTVARGVFQDYYFYLQEWREVRLGHDPWFLILGVFGEYPLNAYGPLFTVLAPLPAINPLLPKLLFALAYLLFAIWLVAGAGRPPQPSGWTRAMLLAWLFGPFPWVEIAYFGHFDVLVGLLCVAAVHARSRRRDVASGTSLGLGVLLKYMPIVLLPFLAVDRGRIRARMGIVAMATIVVGFAASVLVWGPTTFRPLLFAATRHSEHLSVYRYLRSRFSPLELSGIDFNQNPEDLAVPVLFIALLLSWTWARRNAIDPLASSVVAILVTLLFYRVGFSQYQMVLFMLASYWAVRYRAEMPGRAVLQVAMVCYFGWLSVYDLIDCTIGLDFTGIPDWAGLPTFVLGCALLICCLRSATKEGDVPASPA